MFAYCGNNPINFVDSSGHMMVGIIHENPEYSGASALPAPSSAYQTSRSHKKHAIKRVQTEMMLIWTSDYVQSPLGVRDIHRGLKEIRNGFLLILTPVPTLSEEMIAIKDILIGFRRVLNGLSKIFS